MKLSERESMVLESLWMAQKLGSKWVTTRSIAARVGLNNSQAHAAIYNLRGKGLSTQPMVAKYRITRAGIKEAETRAVGKVIEMARDDVQGDPDG